VPAYWFMHSQLVQPACVSLEVQLTPQPTRLSSPPALLLQASRMMELWFGAEAGPANVRRWFKVRAPTGCRRCLCSRGLVARLQPMDQGLYRETKGGHAGPVEESMHPAHTASWMMLLYHNTRGLMSMVTPPCLHSTSVQARMATRIVRSAAACLPIISEHCRVI
jgi:hypothetical protein